MNGWMDRWMDGFMDRWMGRSKDEQIIGSVIVTTLLGGVKMAVGRLVGVQKSHERPQRGRLGQRRRQQKSLRSSSHGGQRSAGDSAFNGGIQECESLLSWAGTDEFISVGRDSE